MTFKRPSKEELIKFYRDLDVRQLRELQTMLASMEADYIDKLDYTRYQLKYVGYVLKMKNMERDNVL